MEIFEATPNPITYTEAQKTAYFQHLALSTLSSFRLHKAAEHFDYEDAEDGSREQGWRNIPEHCLVEVARVDVLADLLKLPEDIRNDLKFAAAAHDYRKKGEILERKRNASWDGATVSVDKTAELLWQSQLSRRAIEMSQAPGSRTILQIEKMLDKGSDDLSETDIAYLVMHYVDDITSGSNWVSEAIVENDGMLVNDFDRRLTSLLENPKYVQEIEEGKLHLGGRTVVEAMLECGGRIENLLEALVSKRSRVDIEHKRLPEYIDTQIKSRIAQVR